MTSKLSSQSRMIVKRAAGGLLIIVNVALIWLLVGRLRELYWLRSIERTPSIDQQIKIATHLTEIRDDRETRWVLSGLLLVKALKVSHMGRHLDEAYAYCEKAIGGAYDEPEAYGTYATVLLRGHNWRAAEHFLDRGVYWQSWWASSKVAADIQKRQESSGIVRQHVLSYRQCQRYLEIAQMAARSGDYQSATRDYWSYRKLVYTRRGFWEGLPLEQQMSELLKALHLQGTPEQRKTIAQELQRQRHAAQQTSERS